MRRVDCALCDNATCPVRQFGGYPGNVSGVLDTAVITSEKMVGTLERTLSTSGNSLSTLEKSVLTLEKTEVPSVFP